ncbi:MAG: mannose-1-phosphate guanylyltransferase [Candidatus Binatia bacterium]
MRTADGQGRAHRFAVIMAGGIGSRFWPQSRRRRPKQLLAINGRQSLLQDTARRLRGALPPANIFVVAPRQLVAPIRRQLPALPRANVLVEPSARGTAACLAFAVAHIARRDPQALVAVLAADHVIADAAGFRRSLDTAFDIAASERSLVTFGIPPTAPETGFGYIEVGAAVRRRPPRVYWATRFVEKPDAATAESFAASGRHLWNSGMFVWRADVFLAAVRQHAPRIARVMDGFAQRGGMAAARRAYARLPALPVDVAVMERAERVAVVAATFDWSDVGSWAAMPGLWGTDAAGNAARGNALLLGSRGTVVYGGTRLVAVLGVDDLIIVDSPDAVLVCPRHRAQDVRQVVAALARGRGRHLC